MRIKKELVEMPYENLTRRWLISIEIEADEDVECCLCGMPIEKNQNAWLIGNDRLNCLRLTCIDENNSPLGTRKWGHCKKAGGRELEDVYVLVKEITRR